MIYISGAITGTSDYMERFKKAQDTLESKGHTVINPALVNSNLPEKCTHDDYMTVSMALLSLCNIIYLLDDWNHSVGAKEEVAWAIEHGLLIITEPTFMDDELKGTLR